MLFNDFVGFEFNGHHSSELGIMRVSSGDRYNETLHPNFQDKTTDIPGGDGVYFFNSYYSNKPFTINIGFDSLTETGLRILRQVFNGKDVGWLIFDETPYKKYKVKVQSPIQLSYICFDEAAEPSSSSIQSETSEIVHNHLLSSSASTSTVTSSGDTQRIYKGDGSIQFIAYDPFAHSVYKYLSYYQNQTLYPVPLPNIAEWAEASGMLPSNPYTDEETQITTTYDGTGQVINLYNPGDLETDFKAYFSVGDISNLTSITLQSDGSVIGQMGFEDMVAQGNDALIRINSRTNLIEGCTSNKQPTGTIYNAYLVSGDFFKIPVNSGTLLTLNSNVNCSGIEYDYLYY